MNFISDSFGLKRFLALEFGNFFSRASKIADNLFKLMIHPSGVWLCFYRPQRSWAKVIFSEACVKNSVHREGGVCSKFSGGRGGWLGGGGVSAPNFRGGGVCSKFRGCLKFSGQGFLLQIFGGGGV